MDSETTTQQTAAKIQERISRFASPNNLKLIHLIFVCLILILIYSLIASDHSRVIRTFVVLGVLVFGALDSWVIFFEMNRS